MNNYAFIDAQNLHMSIEELGWNIDYKRFRVYLKEHYHVHKAYMFMGFKPTEQQLYNFLQECGFILVFKPILELKNGKIKGNCDAELVLQVMIDHADYEKALIVTGDGDFHCLIKYLSEKNKLLTVLAPSFKNCSSLIKKIVQGNLSLVSDLKKKIVYVGHHANKRVEGRKTGGKKWLAGRESQQKAGGIDGQREAGGRGDQRVAGRANQQVAHGRVADGKKWLPSSGAKIVIEGPEARNGKVGERKRYFSNTGKAGFVTKATKTVTLQNPIGNIGNMFGCLPFARMAFCRSAFSKV